MLKQIKSKLKDNTFIYNSYKKFENRNKLTKNYKFVNRKKDREKLCIILGGYKDFLWPVTLKRIKTFIPKDYEVCIVSPGLYSKELNEVARKNDWSYLSVKKNNVALAQNVAINIFSKAKDIVKLDEDMFVTNNMFETLDKTMRNVTDYKPGIISPLIPVNGFGYYELLNRYNLINFYKNNFEKPLYAAGPQYMIENNPKVAKLFWGENNKVPSIDKMNNDFMTQSFTYKPSPIRLSIGCIYFQRSLWEDMEMFKVSKGTGMGEDEAQINAFCINNSRPVIVSENTVAGHLAFGEQSPSMKKYFLENYNKFTV